KNEPKADTRRCRSRDWTAMGSPQYRSSFDAWSPREITRLPQRSASADASAPRPSRQSAASSDPVLRLASRVIVPSRAAAPPDSLPARQAAFERHGVRMPAKPIMAPGVEEARRAER